MWTLISLTRHLFRQRSARILLVCFGLTLVWVQSPVLLGSSVNRVFLGAGSIQAAWPRWVVYAWLILWTLNLDGIRVQFQSRVPHPLEGQSPWFWVRATCETLLLWACAELLLSGISSLGGAWFHVEPSALLTNALTTLAATFLWILLASHLKYRIWILALWGLAMGICELQLLDLEHGWQQSQFGASILLVSFGIAIAANSCWKHRCKSQS